MTTRQEKIRELLKHEVSYILRRELKDPRIGFVTVTDSEITADLRHAKVFVSILGSEAEKIETFNILKKAENFVRYSLSKKLTMKVLPEVDFRLDNSVERSIRIMELLEQIKRDEKDRTA